jgi:hypothetical protein
MVGTSGNAVRRVADVVENAFILPLLTISVTVAAFKIEK